MYASDDCEAFLVLTEYCVSTVSALIDKYFLDVCIFVCLFVTHVPVKQCLNFFLM